MNKRSQIFIVPFLFLIIFAGFFILQKQNQKEKEIHYHAGFQVYFDGKLQDFSGAKYMTVNPCGEEENGQENEQLEKAHHHDGVGDVVHVETEGAKWLDLFKNIRFNSDSSNPVEGYVNGKRVGNIL